jgi:nucleoside 2-deoxyribosyltransferase
METRELIVVFSLGWFILSAIVSMILLAIEKKTGNPVITDEGIAGSKILASIVILMLVPLLIIVAVIEYIRKETSSHNSLPAMYLCGPMENVSKEEGTAWRNDTKTLFEDRCVIYDPYDVEAETKTFTKEDKILRARDIVVKDLECIDKSNVLLVNLNGQGCGTYYEVMYAFMHRKKIIGFGITDNPWNLCHIEMYPNHLDACYAVKRYLKEIS